MASQTFTVTQANLSTDPVASLELEAEGGSLVSPMTAAADPSASSGSFVASPAPDSGAASFTFAVPANATYYVWGRTLSPNFAADSFYVSVDEGAEDIYDTAEDGWSPAWQWSRVNGRAGSGVPLSMNPRTFTLATGTHTITFRAREANTKLDKIFITNDPGATPNKITYTITDLGTLGGTSSAAYGINDSGHVVGASLISSAGTREHAFLYSNGVMQDLGTLSYSDSIAYGINNSGQVTGAVYDGHQDFARVFLYSDGVMQLLPSRSCSLGASSFPCYSNGYSINNSGQVVGRYLYPIGPSWAFLSSGGEMQDIHPPGDSRSVAFGINDPGQVVGFTDPSSGGRYAFLYNSGSGERQLLGRGVALGINNSGQVVGCTNAYPGVFSGGTNCAGHAFFYNEGEVQDLGTLGGSFSTAYGINDSGQVVGSSDGRAFLYDGKVMHDLNSLIPPDSGWLLQTARDINKAGQIVGTGVIGGQVHAFLITPLLELEAEGGSLVSPMTAAADPSASSGSFVASPAPDSGAASFSFVVPVNATYYVWGRTLSPNFAADSFYVSVDEGAEDIYDTAEDGWSPAWQWSRVNGRAGSGVPLSMNPRTFTLATGTHTITFRAREANTKLDKIFITNDPGATPKP